MIEITAEYLASQGLSATFPERFWSKIENRGPGECWPWLAALSDGYPWIARGIRRSKSIRGHVASWILHYGPIPEGKCVLHNCPNTHLRSCTNPNHLKLGDRSDNVADMIRMGTWRQINPDSTGRVKLTWEVVDLIRKECSMNDESVRQFASAFNVQVATVTDILAFRSWNPKYHP